MKKIEKMFPGYCTPSESDFSELWDNCIFVFDTNVLLNLYRYDLRTRNELIRIMSEISERLWIPHQVALEFYNNRIATINDLEKAYDKIRKDVFKNNFNTIKKELEKYKRHPILNVDELIKKIEDSIQNIEKELDILKEKHPNWSEKDEIKEAIENIFNEKVGIPYTQEELEEIYKRGKARYDLYIPPGYEDFNEKPDFRKYGDLIIWFQLIDKSNEAKKPIILVTDDAKDDWWLNIDGKRNIRPELIQEFVSATNQSFYMYSSKRFMNYAEKYLNIKVDQEAIAEVEKVMKLDDELQAQYKFYGEIMGKQIIGLPEIKVPEIKAPEFKVPEIKVPEIKAPEFKVPEIKESIKEKHRKEVDQSDEKSNS